MKNNDVFNLILLILLALTVGLLVAAMTSQAVEKSDLIPVLLAAAASATGFAALLMVFIKEKKKEKRDSDED